MIVFKECEEQRRSAEVDQQKELEERMAVGEEEHKKGSKKHFCSFCQLHFYFTPVQMLKHDRSCRDMKS